MNRLRSFLPALAVVVAACAASSCSRSQASDEGEINQSVQRLVAAVSAKDMNGIMAYYTPDETLLVYDAIPPRQYVGAAAYRKDWEGFLAAYAGGVKSEVTDWKAEVDGNHAYGHGIFRMAGTDKDGKPVDVTVRVTDVFSKINGKWLVVHEHVSWPVDLATGKADLNSKP